MILNNLKYNKVTLKCLIIFIHLFILIEINQSYAQTQITKWQNGKTGAISLTYDDGIITQFKDVLPIMNRLHFPGTFFIVTGQLSGSRYSAKFIGRPVEQIIKETESQPTNQDNFFERASAVRFLGYKGTGSCFFKAGQLFENGDLQKAYLIIDSAYAAVRAGTLKPGQDITPEAAATAENSWADFRKYAAEGHEFACHSISHPYMAILDTPNMHYELEKSREDILTHLGSAHTFSAEVPFGIEDKRVMKYVLGSNLFPALRNQMPDSFLHEINRGYKEAPGISNKEYVQWQRGPLTETPMSVMKSWVDTLLAHENIWLVLVFHGVDDVGWEPIKHEELAIYFEYIKEKEDRLWVATFKDVTKYMRERMNANIKVNKRGNKTIVTLTHSLDKKLYNLPLTLKTYVPSDWEKIKVKQGNHLKEINPQQDAGGNFVLYHALPNVGAIELTGD